MEVLGPRELLRGQSRANHVAVALDEAPVRLVREGELGEAGHENWVDDSEQKVSTTTAGRPSDRGDQVSASTIGPSVSAGKIIRPA